MEEITKTKIAAELTALEEQEAEILCWAHKQAESILRIGKALKNIKDGKLYSAKGYNSFAEYLDDRAFESLKIGQTQGYKYVSVYERYGNRLHMPPTSNVDVLLELSKMPAEEVEKLESDGKIEGMTTKEAQQIRRELEQANQQISLLTDEKEQDAEALREEQKLSTAAMERAQEAEEEADELKKRNAELERLLKEAESKTVEAVVQPDEETISKIKAEAKAEAEKAAQAEIKAAADKAKKIEQEHKEQFDKAISDILNEKTASDNRIKELEQKLQSAEKPADEQYIEYKFYFKETQLNLGKFLDVIKKVEDPEKKEKFKGAAIEFVTRILNELKKSED